MGHKAKFAAAAAAAADNLLHAWAMSVCVRKRDKRPFLEIAFPWKDLGQGQKVVSRQ